MKDQMRYDYHFHIENEGSMIAARPCYDISVSAPLVDIEVGRILLLPHKRPAMDIGRFEIVCVETVLPFTAEQSQGIHVQVKQKGMQKSKLTPGDPIAEPD
ncbi:hypothetical protein AWB67_07221 [Caballeronia terrestris]|uniref:Uncharacterized protein n=2 Tax=Caballeronia terrestris TaxID=1226301 RepID=A0A158L0P0_9BURK|nr:hypothetical protein AWB67_07221 [Caballeronia terrestris]